MRRSASAIAISSNYFFMLAISSQHIQSTAIPCKSFQPGVHAHQHLDAGRRPSVFDRKKRRQSLFISRIRQCRVCESDIIAADFNIERNSTEFHPSDTHCSKVLQGDTK